MIFTDFDPSTLPQFFYLYIFCLLSNCLMYHCVIAKYSSFSILLIAAVCPPYKIVENWKFNFSLGTGDQYPSPCPISSKSVEWRFNGFQNGGRPPCWIFKIQTLLTAGAVKRLIWHRRTRFRKERSSHCGDIAIFVIFRMAAAAVLDFQKLEIFTHGPL